MKSMVCTENCVESGVGPNSEFGKNFFFLYYISARTTYSLIQKRKRLSRKGEKDLRNMMRRKKTFALTRLSLFDVCSIWAKWQQRNEENVVKEPRGWAGQFLCDEDIYAIRGVSLFSRDQPGIPSLTCDLFFLTTKLYWLHSHSLTST